jgi:hypothetical protein
MASEAEKQEKAWLATVDTLQRFYTVVVAIALTSGLGKLIASLETSNSLWTDAQLVALSIAQLSTIVPFYHGMERHLYDAHRIAPKLGKGGRPIPLLLDIFAFIIEGSVLFTMGRNLDNPTKFLVLWTALLLVDIAWTLTVWRLQRSPRPLWAVNNFAWCVAAWTLWLLLPHMLAIFRTSSSNQAFILALVIAAAEVGRSVVDYVSNWKFYFPNRPTYEPSSQPQVKLESSG